MAAEPSTWTGFYIGAHVGHGWTKDKLTSSGGPESVDYKGALGGIHAGYQQQYQKIVYGVEADISRTNMRWKRADITASYTDITTLDTPWIGSFRARVGYDLNPFLLYGTAGVGWTQWNYHNTDTDHMTGVTSRLIGSRNGFGFVIGGGAEVKVSDNLSVRLEGLHYRFSDAKVNAPLDGASNANPTLSQNISVVRAGLSWRF